MSWIKYNEDEHSKTLEEKTYLCRLEYPDGRIKYTLKHFSVYGNSIKRGYFTTNGKKYKVTHFCKYKKLEDEWSKR